MGEAEIRGEIVLGGCMVGDESPDYQCRGCGTYLPWVRPAEPPDSNPIAVLITDRHRAGVRS